MKKQNQTLRVLHTEASTGWGGQEIRILDECAGFIARGHEAYVAAPAEAPIVQAAKDRNIPVHTLPLNRRRVKSLVAFQRLLREIRPDVIVTHSSSDSWLTAFATRTLRPRIPVVRTRHISTPVAPGLINRWLYGTVPSRVVTTGEAISSHLIQTLKLSPDSVVSVPTGADMTRFVPGDKASARKKLDIPVGGPVIGIVATLRSWKGHRFLISALKEPALDGARLIIVGDGPQSSSLAKQVNDLGLNDRVRFTGQQKDVLPWMQALDVFAFPSTGNEGVPQALVQAMGCGLPVVTTAVGAIPEVVRHEQDGLIVASENPKALAEGISRLLRDPELSRRLSESGQARVMSKFSSAAMLDTMEEILSKAASKIS